MKTGLDRNKEVREEFVQSHVQGTPVSLKDLATRHGRSYVAVRKAASEGRWSEQVALAKVQRDTTIASKITEGNALTDSLIQQVIGREVEVRRRHAMVARCLQGLALQRLIALAAEDMSPALALHMLQVGIEHERNALGLIEDTKNYCDPEPDDKKQLREAVEKATEILRRYQPQGRTSPCEDVGTKRSGDSALE